MIDNEVEHQIIFPAGGRARPSLAASKVGQRSQCPAPSRPFCEAQIAVDGGDHLEGVTPAGQFRPTPHVE
jgi:hypothetical protein